MINKFLIAALLVAATQSSYAYVDRNLMLKGKLVSFDAKVAVIKTEKGPINVPSQVIKEMDYRSGQSVLVFVDVADLISLNREKFKAAGLLKDEDESKKVETK